MEESFYFDGRTSKSHQCRLHLSEEAFYIYLTSDNEEEKESVIIWNRSEIKNFDYNGKVLYIKYGDFPSQSLEITGHLASNYFDELGKKNISKKSKGFWLKNKKKAVIYLLIGFIAFCVGSYFLILPWVGEKSVALIPVEAEIELGNNIAESIVQSTTELDSATFFSNQFVSNLKTDKTYPLKVTVIQSDEINAFALPGGRIFIYSSIIKKMNTYEEFTALLGHEMSHVSEQHSLKSIGRTIASSFFISLIFGDVSGISAGIIDQANQFKQLNYSRELETDADNKGFEFMLKNKVSPKGMVDLLTLLQKESGDDPSLMKYFSTHPETSERIKNIQNKKSINVRFNENAKLALIFKQLKSQLK
jgi:predicted Zn-dependent protease